eukprot:190725_1
MLKLWEARTHAVPIDITVEKETPKETEDNMKITSLGVSNIMYEIKFTDFHDHFDPILQAAKKIPRRLIDSSVATYNTSQILTPDRRRLAITNVDEQQTPYRSVGLIKIMKELQNGDGRSVGATGSIVHITNGDGQTNEIFVLAAAHDLIVFSADGKHSTEFESIDKYRFYPHYDGSDYAMRATNDNGYPMVASWVVSSYKTMSGAPRYGDEFDFGILKFKATPPFEGHALELKPDSNVPANKGNHFRAMVMYDITHNGLTKEYTMQTQPVNIYCPGDGNACQYDGQFIKGGYCGGPIIYDGGISAIQVSHSPVDAKIRNYCDDTDAANNYANCRGYAARINPSRAVAIEVLTKYNVYLKFNSKRDYENIYNDYGLENIYANDYNNDIELQQMHEIYKLKQKINREGMRLNKLFHKKKRKRMHGQKR